MSDVRLEGHTFWDFDLDAVKKVIRVEGREVAKIARRRVSRRAISKAGQPPGRRGGTLRKTIKAKVGRKGLESVITHFDFPGTRYPFLLVSGTKHIRPREDYIAYAQAQRKNETVSALRSALAVTIKPK